MHGEFDGYSIGTNYTYGYFAYVSPSWLSLAALNLSVAFPTRRPLRYLELGYGNGVSLNIHAAANPGEYWGTDINPAHVEFARDLAAASEVKVNLLDLSFAELLEHDGLPEFDFITAHGVWSWVSDANRTAIVELIRRKLADGGIFCVSYNALPGKAAIAPLQRIMRLHSERTLSSSDEYGKLIDAINFLEALALASPRGFFGRTPSAAEVLKGLRSKNPAYLIHEYFAQHWKPALMLDVATQLTAAGLRFAGSANLIEHDKNWGADAAGRAIINSFDDKLMRETVRDYLINRVFRRDIFVKGNEPLAPETRQRLLREQLFLILMPHDEVTFETADGDHGAGERTRLYRDILALLATEPKSPKSAAEIAAGCGTAVSFEDVFSSLLVLTDLQAVRPARPDPSAEARAACQRLNRRIAQECQRGRQISALASAAIGSGIEVSQWHSAFEAAFRTGARTPSELLAYAAPLMITNQVPTAQSDGAAARAVTALRQAVLFLKSLPIYDALELTQKDTSLSGNGIFPEALSTH